MPCGTAAPISSPRSPIAASATPRAIFWGRWSRAGFLPAARHAHAARGRFRTSRPTARPASATGASTTSSRCSQPVRPPISTLSAAPWPRSSTAPRDRSPRDRRLPQIRAADRDAGAEIGGGVPTRRPWRAAGAAWLSAWLCAASRRYVLQSAPFVPSMPARKDPRGTGGNRADPAGLPQKMPGIDGRQGGLRGQADISARSAAACPGRRHCSQIRKERQSRRNRMRSDIDIKRDVEDELRWNPDLDATDIAVTVRDGVVTLAGYTRSYNDKLEAEAAAKRVAGVVGVANDIE